MPHKTLSPSPNSILISLLLGALVGTALHHLSAILPNSQKFIQTYLTDGALYLIGQIFLRLLTMLVVPIVFVSLTCGVASLGDLRKLGRIGLRTFIFYLATTALAISLALLVASLLSPGRNFQLNSAQQIPFTPPPSPFFLDTLLSIFPRNILAAMAEGQMLAVITSAIFFGIALNLTAANSSSKSISSFLFELNEVLLTLVSITIRLAPIGVFALLARTFATQGWQTLLPLFLYFISVLLALAIHAGLIYPLLLKILTGLSPLCFYRKFRDVLTFAFATSSSNATLPVTLNTVEKKLGVSNQIASFTIPLGATINMDGTAIMQGSATVFLAQVFNIPLTSLDYLTILLTATLASIGTAGIPGVGLILLTLVLQQVGIPTDGIALILGVDRLLDMARTAVNVTGDAIAACYVAKKENQLDLNRFFDHNTSSLR
ncbi:MAG: dicarboxylate/amino acid:cation symporter [Chthoniobacterales bacterium]|nr:dicarboxylate/amino acid:cation symporter [Chthoniobacterales bacterium]MCX7713178.1 dicarboxylate/amino acid:cation symporter [Chthoniobacterales bacterium]